MRAIVIWLTALATAMLTPSAVFAQDFSFTSYRDIEAAYQGQHAEIESLQARLASLESTVAAGEPQHGCVDAANCDTCHSCTSSCCQECCQPACGGWIGGADVYFLKPHWETNSALAVFTFGVATDSVESVEFDYDFETAYGLWAGYRGASGLGVRGRYFEFDHGSSLAGTVGVDQFIASASPLGLSFFMTGGPDDEFAISSDLQLRSLDLECSQLVPFGGLIVDASAGVRLFHMQQHYDATGFSDFFGITEAIRSQHDFEGLGPTLALGLRRALGSSGLSLFGGARGSILFGKAEQQVSAEAWDDFGPLVSAQATNARWDVISVLEADVGAEYAMFLGGSRWFARTNLVGQFYSGAGNAANNEMFLDSGFDESLDNGVNLGLFGLRIGAGVDY